MKIKNSFAMSALAASVLLAACGGGGGDNDSDGGGNTAGSVVLSGQVVDGPIAGAQVCLFSDGAAARTASGEAICSSETDAQGNYTITIPRSLAPGALTLVASKGSNIKLASSLGYLDKVLEAANASGAINQASLPGARVTHFTTADFALADTNKDGTVSIAELNAYVSDFTKVQKIAAIVKAVIDFAQDGNLIGGQTTNTLSLAQAAARDEKLGNSNKTADEWFSDPANAEIVAAVNQDLAKDLEGSFANYRLSTVVISHVIPPEVSTVVNGVGASLYCQINTQNESDIVQIAFNAARRIAVVKFEAEDDEEAGQFVGSYDPATGKVNLTEYMPLHANLASPNGIVYYTEASFNLSGTVNPTTGNISGDFSEMTENSWTVDSTRQKCSAAGTFTAEKI